MHFFYVLSHLLSLCSFHICFSDLVVIPFSLGHLTASQKSILLLHEHFSRGNRWWFFSNNYLSLQNWQVLESWGDWRAAYPFRAIMALGQWVFKATCSVKLTLTGVELPNIYWCEDATVHTFLSWVDGGHWTKRPFSLVVVDPDFDLVGGEGRDALILEDISRGVRRCHSSLHPALCPMWAESHHIAEAWTALQLLRHRLRRYEMAQRYDSDSRAWLILKILIPTKITSMYGLGQLE